MKPWVVYTTARLAIFLVTLTVLLVLGTGWIWGTIFASGIALALSILFLGKLRQRVADGIQNRVEKPGHDVDSSIEDKQIADSA